MSKLLWKLRYALNIGGRTGMRFGLCWDCAETAWTDSDFGRDMTPSEAVDEELACWGD